MRQIIILSFLTFANSTFGQLQLNSLLSNPDYYVYNNSKDTLYLTKIDVSKNETFWDRPLKTSKIIDTIQIDGIGSKEIVFERTYSGTSRIIMQAWQSKEDTKIHKYEIWNIDTKTLLFEAIYDYEFNYEYWSLPNELYPDSLFDKNGWNKGICSYKYDFSLDNTLQITIVNIKYKNMNNDCIADKKEGRYKFANGKYTNE